VFAPRGPLPTRRMAAHWVVIAAAALTTLVAAAVGAALAAFAGQALPQAVRHDLVHAPGNSLAAAGPFGTGDARSTGAALKTAIGGALPGVPFDFYSGTWSDPLGFVPGALPARPAGVGSGTTPLLEAAAFDGVTSHAVLVAGAWPTSAAAPSGEIPAALPATTAALLRLHVGDVLRLQDRNTMGRVTFTVTGLYAQRQLSGTAASYWQLDSLPASGSSAASGFITYGPLIVPPAAFPARLAAGTGTWVAQPDLTSVSDTELSAISADIAGLENSLNNSNSLSGMQLTSDLPTLLADIGSNLALARSLLAISGLQLLVLAVAALLAVARLLATQREGETALLVARGATRWQLIRLTAAEVVPLSVVTALAGGVAGVWLARWLGGSLYGAGTAGGAVPAGGISLTAAGTWTDALAATALIAVLATGALLYPVLRPATGSTRARRGRGAALAGATRAGADLALIALAVLAGWQLRRYSAVATSSTGAPAAIDPVLALAPALALAGGTVLTLRLLPAAARAADRLAAGRRGLTTAMAGWQFSRQPLRQGGAALLIVMAVATGTLALAQHQSWARSTSDQAAQATGADVRVDLATPLAPTGTTRVTRAPGVADAMAVASDQETLPAPVLAVNSLQAAQVVRLRPDQSPLPAARLFGAIRPAATDGGTVVPGRPAAIRLVATLGPAPVTGAAVALTVTDATGGTFQLPASGTLPADGRPHQLTAQLSPGFAYPLRISQLTMTYTMPTQSYQHPVTLTITGVTVAGWDAVASSPELESAPPGRASSPSDASLLPVPGGAAVTFSPGFGTTSGLNALGMVTTSSVYGQVTLTAKNLAPAVVPAIATKAFDNANHTSPGQTVSATVNGITMPMRIVAQVDSFPTVTGPGLIVDLTTLQSLLVADGGSPLPVTQWWLTTAGHGVPPALAAALPAGADVTSGAAMAAATADDPLSAAPQQALLAVTAAAALLAITGFLVSIAANVRQRRAENALLAALGVPQRSAAAQLFLEKLLLSVPAALLGLVLGIVVAELLVPAVTLTATAQPPVPPAVTLFDLPQTVPLAIVIAVLPALAAALVVFRRPDPAAELRAAEAA
jgi:ABC-type antimicrobial peptide transport system permease subunit